MKEFQNNLEKNHYRGKSKDDGKWYFGDFLHLRKTTYCFKSDYESDPDNDVYQIIFHLFLDQVFSSYQIINPLHVLQIL